MRIRPFHFADLPAGADLDVVEQLLRSEDCLRGYPVPGFDWYSLSAILLKRYEYDPTFYLMLDRNAASALLSLRSEPGRVAPAHPKARAIAAVMVYATASDMVLDPQMALGETALPNGDDHARAEALPLVALQNQRPSTYLDIALGRKSVCTPDEINGELTEEIERECLTLDVAQWDRLRPDYGAALKLALIRLRSRPDAVDPAQMAEFLRWSYEEYMFLPGAMIYASMFLGRNRRKGMFKGLHSGKPDRALAGVRNAAWDMGLLTRWRRAVLREARRNAYVLLCSFDKAVLDCATTDLFATTPSVLRRRWVEEWGGAAGAKLFNVYMQYVIGHQTDRTRVARVDGHRQARWAAMEAELESELLVAAKRV